MKNSILGKARWLREVALATSKNNGARVAREWLKYAAMFVMLFTIGSGNAWGADVDSGEIPSFTETSGSLDTYISYAAAQAGGTTAPVISSSNIRIYRKSKSTVGLGGTLTVTASGGAKITSITFTISSSLGYSISVDGGAATTGTNSIITKSLINATSVTLQNYSTSQMDVKRIQVTYNTADPAYTITATRNNDSYGTVEVSGTTITATPAAGYRVIAGNDGYTVTSGSATVVNNGDNTFTVTPSSDCTVRINFESKGCTDHGASSITGGALSDADHGPLHAYYDYSTSQILYTKSDLDLAAGKKGTIKSIYFEYSGDAAMAARTIKIYMANTDLSSLTTSNYVPYASFTQVYSGTFSCGSAGWYEITLDTPFDYNGAGQLAVMIDDNTNTYESSKSFKYHSATGKQIYKRQDDTDIDPASWTPASAIDYRPNTKFCIQEADMTPATVTLMDNGATITEASAGAGVTLPSRAGCAGYTFAGWTKTWVAPQESWTTTAPTIIPAGSYTPTANENLYPVYTKTEGGGGNSNITINFGYTDWGKGAQYSGTTYDEVTQTKSGITVTQTRNGSNMYANSNATRFYPSNTLTFTSSVGNISSVVFTCSQFKTDITTDVGTCTSTSSELSWSGNDASVTFTGSGTSYAQFSQAVVTVGGGSTTSYISEPACAATHDITFKEWEGGGAASGSPSTGSYAESATSFSFGATPPSKTGHSIEGFYTASSANSGVKVANSDRSFVASVASWTNESSQITKNSNIDLYIKWTEKVTAITLDKGTGGTADGSASVTYGNSALTSISHATKTNYHLTGYYTAASDGTKVLNDDGTFAASNVAGYVTSGNWSYDNTSLTLYAQWEINDYPIHWKYNGDSDWTSGVGSDNNHATHGNTITSMPTEPTSAACDGMKVFVGWTATPIVGTTDTRPDDLFTTVAGSPKITSETTFYAVFATASGGGAGFDGTNGGTFKIYADVSGTKHYATSSLSSGKFGSTTDASNAAEFTIEPVTGGFTIKLGSDFVYYKSSTNLGTQATSYTWTFADGTKGTWRANSGTSGRGFIYRAGTGFGGYNTSNVTAGGTEYFDLEIGGGTTYSDYSTSCGASLNASDAYVVSTNGQKVKVVVPVTAQNFSSNAELSYSGVSAPYSFVEWTNGNSITAGSTLETGLILQYQPSAYNTTNDLTVTFSATGASDKTATVHGRSLPEQFAIVATSSTKDWAMPANTANTAASRTGLEVTTSGTPETVEALPGSYVYTLVSVDDSRYDANGFAVRLKGYNTNGYLKAQAANQADVANLTDAATTDQYEWIITTTDHTTYNIASNNSDIAAVRNLRYYNSYFGVYASGEQSIRLLPIGCSTQPEKVVMTPTHNSVTITFLGSAASHTLDIKQGSDTKYNGTVTSGQEITGLTAATDYTYTLTPEGSSACAVEGEFSTTAAPIDITLVRHNRDDEVLTAVANPYTLPTAADACAEWVFVGWATSAQNNASSAPTLVTEATADGTYYAVYRKNGGAGSSTITDALDYADFDATGTTYVNFSGVNLGTGHSAVYAGNNAAYNSEAIQLRSKNSTSGIVTTTSGGVAKSVSVSWNSYTSSGKVLNIYGKNSAYSAASDLYSTSSQGTLLGTITSGTNTSLTIDGSYGHLGVRSSDGAVYINTLTIVWTTGATYTYSTAGYTDCVVCTESGAAFSLGNNVTKNTESANFTNTVTYTNTNNSTKTWSSSNTSVATVSSTGEVAIVGTGETVISLTQPVDYGATSSDDDNVCAVSIRYTLTVTPPTVEVVEVTSDDKIIIEHDIDGISGVVIEEATTKLSGTLADDIFFSKYYEAASNMKLFGLYNGTNTYIDLSKLRVRQSQNADGWYNSTGSLGYVELANVSKLGEDFPSYMMPPFTEIIFWSNNYGTYGKNSWTNNEDLRKCVSMEINDVKYDINDLEKGDVPNWYCLGDYTTYNTVDADGNNQFNFNGDDALILERWNGSSWEAIDLFGAGTSAAPKLPTYDTNNAKPSITSASDIENGKIKVVTNTSGSSKDAETYTINGTSGTKLNDSPGGWWALSADAGVTIPLSANRYYLLRNKNVKSGADAVAKNTERFATLGSEWHGEPVGGGNEAICYSGKLFSAVGQYDFANYYTEWVEVSASDIEFEEVGDGTMAVTVDNLASHSCNTLRIQVADAEDNVLAQVDYKVPIMVKSGTVETTNTIFTGFANAADVCSTCDVVIMNGATLKKVDGDINALRNVEVYAGGNLYIPTDKELTVNQLIVRSKEDVVGKADIQGTLARYNSTILHDKRIPGTRWYFFTLPYDCNVADIYFRNGDAAVHGTDFLIKYYDGEQRAATGTSSQSNSNHWKQFTGSTLLAGQGYIVAVEPKTGHTYAELRFPMIDADLTKSSTTVSVHAWGGNRTDEVLRPNHKGWNLVGNPFLNTYKSNALANPLRLGTLEPDGKGKWVINTTGGNNIRFVYVPVDGGANTYNTVAVSSQALDPFLSYFVQIGTDASKTGGDNPSAEMGIEFTKANVAKASIVRRAPSEVEDNNEEPIWAVFDLTNDKNEIDKTTLLISDRFTDDYDIMNDGLKWRGDKYTKYTNPIIATRNNEGEMAFNALPDESAAVTGVPVNFYAAYNGQYTISLNGQYGIDEIKSAQLFDATTNQYYDLLTDNYTFTADKGENTSRFTLFVRVERKKAPEVATGNDNILGNGQLSLIAIDKTLVLSGLTENADVYVYDMSGKLVRGERAAGNGVWRATVPSQGVYFVRVNSAGGQQTLRTIVK